MSIIKGLRAAAARSPTVSNAVTVTGLMSSGGLAVGELTETTARKLSAVDGCMEILSNSISKLPNFVMDGRTREHVDHYLLRLLNVRPNEAMTPSIRRKVLENSRNEGGNGYDWIIRDPRTGIIRELIPVPWWLVQPWRDEAGRVWYTVTHPVTGTPMVLPNEDICHYKATTRDGLTGISPLRRASEVLAAAQAAQAVFSVIRDSLAAKGGEPVKKGRIVIATVKGDIHDIGKNIVRTVLENYGYDVLDLGRDVPPETVVDAVVKENIRLVGLSALMTTTLPSMEETVRQLHTLPNPPSIMVGGAVVTPEYAQKMGAFYAKDARASVEIAKKVLG